MTLNVCRLLHTACMGLYTVQVPTHLCVVMRWGMQVMCTHTYVYSTYCSNWAFPFGGGREKRGRKIVSQLLPKRTHGHQYDIHVHEERLGNIFRELRRTGSHLGYDIQYVYSRLTLPQDDHHTCSTVLAHPTSEMYIELGIMYMYICRSTGGGQWLTFWRVSPPTLSRPSAQGSEN